MSFPAAADPRSAGREAAERRNWVDAYELLRSVDDPGPGDLELRADVALWSRHGQERMDLLERAAAEYLRAEDLHGAARVSLKLCRDHWERGDAAVASGCLHHARSLLAGLPESPEHAYLMWNLARGAMHRGDIDALVARATEAIEIARRVGSRDVEALGTLDMGHALVASGRFDEGMALMDEANAAASSGTLDLQTAGTIYCSTIWSCRNLGDWRRAAAWTDVSLRWCDRQGVTGFPGLCRFHRAEVLRMRGALDEAEIDARVAIDELISERPLYAGWGYMELGEIRRRRGDIAEAEAAFETALELGTDPQPGYALLRLAMGDIAGARAMIARALAASDIMSREERVLCLPAAVTIALAANDADGASEQLSELQTLATRLGTSHGRAVASCAQGEIALAKGQPGDAREPLRRAWDAWCETDAPYEAATTRVLLAIAHRTVGDEAAARIELAAALTTFERLGAHRKADEVRALLLVPATAANPERVRTTFVLVDMVGSTPLVELLGDDAWTELLAWYERTLRSLFDVDDGRVVKQEGDGFFVTFDQASGALDCSIGIQRGLVAHRRDHGFAPRVRIGLHTANAHRREGDYAGLGVHTAARIAGCADADEIVASRDTLAASEGAYQVGDARLLALKGLSEEVEVATVAWR
jgi:class 3 adenylate cyclase